MFYHFSLYRYARFYHYLMARKSPHPIRWDMRGRFLYIIVTQWVITRRV
jgi:hypothetical protein